MSAMTKRKNKYDNTRREAKAIAGPCTACKALLPQAKPPREQKTHEYARKGRIAYCRCDNCGNTWKKPIPFEIKSTEGDE